MQEILDEAYLFVTSLNRVIAIYCEESGLGIRSQGSVCMAPEANVLITSPCLPPIVLQFPFQMQTRPHQPVCFTAQKAGCPSWVLAYPEVSLVRGMVNEPRSSSLFVLGPYSEYGGSSPQIFTSLSKVLGPSFFQSMIFDNICTGMQIQWKPHGAINNCRYCKVTDVKWFPERFLYIIFKNWLLSSLWVIVKVKKAAPILNLKQHF